MNLHALTDGAIAGTGIIKLTGSTGTFGGALITSDGNTATVVIRKDSETGKKLFDIAVTSSAFIPMPVDIEQAVQLHYSITGTNALAQLYEWVS